MDKFDPHYHPDVNLKENQYDTILCTYVLNVIDDPEVEKQVLDNILNLLKPNGKAYLSVRRDIKKEGYTSKGTFQKNVELKLPKLIDKKGSFCIYELTKN
jgi:2-polyprenyl-3-methyl-5-hydroxy-6-metoxy-1,4-benzoquinol methylase